MSEKMTPMKKKRSGIVLNLYAQTGSQFMDDVEKEEDPDAIVNSLVEKDAKKEAAKAEAAEVRVIQPDPSTNKPDPAADGSKEEKKGEKKEEKGKAGGQGGAADKPPQTPPPSHGGPTVSIELKNNNNE